MSWYIVVARKRRGPLSTAQLSEELQAGKVPVDAWAWTEGMDEWVPAGEIRELRPRPVVQRAVPQPEPERAPRAAVNAPQPASRGAAKTASSQSDETSAQTWQQKLGVLLLRHWRGELSLPVSFWVMVLASTLVVAFVGAIVDALSLADAPEFVAFVTLAFLAFASAIIVWQLVGVWRSAQNYRARGGQKIWAQLAMGATAIAAARFVVDVILAQAPIALEMLRIIDGDKEYSNYSVLVLRGGEELSIEGPIGFGLTAKVDDALASFDNVRVVRLNSEGGRLAEAYRLGDRIRDRGLSTYVEGECSSACVIALASGAERLLGPKARVGLNEVGYRGLVPGWAEPDRRKYIEFLKGQGVSAGFVSTAMRRGGEGMWYPSHEQLIDSGIASAMAEPGEFDDSLQNVSVTEVPEEST